MKKFLSLILVTIIGSTLLFLPIASGQGKLNELLPDPSDPFATTDVSDAASFLSDISDREKRGEKISDADRAKETKARELLKSKLNKAENPLPQGTPQRLIAGITRVVLAIASTLAALGFMIAGILYVTSQGSDDQIKKAKDIILYTIIGLIVIAVSYAVFTGVVQLTSSSTLFK